MTLTDIVLIILACCQVEHSWLRSARPLGLLPSAAPIVISYRGERLNTFQAQF
jgi:hypothetical protein